MKWYYNDGGRHLYYKATNVRDCVTRAIAIAMDKDYKIVYNELYELCKRSKYNETPRSGITDETIKKYLEPLGWHYVKNPKRSLTAELPTGCIICHLNGHLCAIINGVVNDTWNIFDDSYNLKNMYIKGWWVQN